MKKNILAALVLLFVFNAFAMNSKQVDYICEGRIAELNEQQECLDADCRAFKVNSIAVLLVSTCSQGKAEKLVASYTEYVIQTDIPAPIYSYNHVPRLGQKGTMMVKAGTLVYPDGWVVH
jgi:hypothetical protein